MVNLPVIGFTRLHTLASLLWPALRFRSLACLHYGFACSLARLLHGAQSYDPNPTECFELRQEPPLRLRNSKLPPPLRLQQRSCRSRPPPKAELCSPHANPPIPRRWPVLRHRSALLAPVESGVAAALLSTIQHVCGSASGAAGRGRRAARLASSLRPRCSPRELLPRWPAPFDAFKRLP